MRLFGGLFLLFTPFLLLIFFEDKKRGFIFILFWVIFFQTTLAFFTQLLEIFKYEVLLTANILVALGVLLKTGREGVWSKWRINNFLKIDWVLVLVAAIFVLNLWQVHYNYRGKINLATDTTVVYHDVKNFKYPYPYYSDEWYSVALIKNSIETKGLPIKNPFIKGEKFFNFELFFHSFLSEIILLLGLNPLTAYTKITIFFNTLIGVLVYLFLRIEKIKKLPSAIAVLSLLYISAGANLPGIWNLIPLTLGIISFLIGICFIALAEGQTKEMPGRALRLSLKMAGLSSILVFLFYPPLLVFYLTGLLIFIYGRI